MHDRLPLLEATLDLIEEGVAVLDEDSCIAFWNQAAVDLTGFARAEMVARPCPPQLYSIDEHHLEMADAANLGHSQAAPDSCGFGQSAAGYSDGPMPAKDAAANDRLLTTAALVSLHHRLGHGVAAMLRRLPLADASGRVVGAALLFYPVEQADALPHGERSGAGGGIERSQAAMEDRLDEAYHQWTTRHIPFGLQWITVDQAAQMRKTHGRDACESMFKTVENTLTHGLCPTDILGRWGDDEFLVLSHERTAEQLSDRVQRLAGLARTADFRWWGDRISLTVSIGTGRLVEGEALHALLDRAREAMHASLRAGGNHVTHSH